MNPVSERVSSRTTVGNSARKNTIVLGLPIVSEKLARNARAGCCANSGSPLSSSCGAAVHILHAR